MTSDESEGDGPARKRAKHKKNSKHHSKKRHRSKSSYSSGSSHSSRSSHSQSSSSLSSSRSSTSVVSKVSNWLKDSDQKESGNLRDGLLSVQVNGGKANFPIEYKTGSSWDVLENALKEGCGIGENLDDCSLTYPKTTSHSVITMVLNKNTIQQFNEYLKAIQGDPLAHVVVSLDGFVTKVQKSKFISCPRSPSEAPFASKDVHALIRAFDGKSWNHEYVGMFGRDEREMVFRHLVTESLVEKICRKCKHPHTIPKTVDPKKAPKLGKLKALVKPEEHRMFFQKRAIIAKIFGNENIAVNPHYMECPICGLVVSMGRFNNFATKSSKFVDHLKKKHSDDPIKGTHIDIGKMLLMRHKQYHENNRKIVVPAIKKCVEHNGLHELVPVTVPGTSRTPTDRQKQLLKVQLPDDFQCKHDSLSTTLDEHPANDEEFSIYCSCLMGHFKPSSVKILFRPNASIIIHDTEDARRNGLLMSVGDMHPMLMRGQEMINAGLFEESHPMFQEFELQSLMYGGVSLDPMRGITDYQSRCQGLSYIQERMMGASSGSEAYSLYRGSHRVGTGKQEFKKGALDLPPMDCVSHWGLSTSSWLKKKIAPALFDGVLVQLAMSYVEIISRVTSVQLNGPAYQTSYVGLIMDGKGVSPGVEVLDGLLHGVTPPLGKKEIEELSKDGYSSLLKNLIEKFSSGELKWIKQTEVFMLQLLDKAIAVPVAKYGLDKGGDGEDVKKRVEEVCLYANACLNCLEKSCETGQPPSCTVSCNECFKEKEVCAAHQDLYEEWAGDKRPCQNCAIQNRFCRRVKVLASISDMETGYFGYANMVRHSILDLLAGNTDTLHLHDPCHIIKNAVCSLDKGAHFDGECTFDSSDLSVLLSSTDDELQTKLSGGLSHHAVVQLDKHSDELCLQRLSANVTEVATSVGSLIKTDVPEVRRPWFSEAHDEIHKPLFLTITGSGVVWVVDDFEQKVFYYRLCTSPRKLSFLGKPDQGSTTSDPHIGMEVDAGSMTWKVVGGITTLAKESCVVVADVGFKALRVIRGSKLVRKKNDYEKQYVPISKVAQQPNMKMVVITLQVLNRPQLVPCGVDFNGNNHLIILDPVNKCVEVVDVVADMSSGISLLTLDCGSQCHPLDCCVVNNDLIAVSDMIGKEVLLLSMNDKEIKSSVKGDFSPSGLCAIGEVVLFSDKEQHCVFAFEVDEKEVEVFIGRKGIAGFEDGCLSKATLTAPVGLAKRGTTVYIAEHPMAHQGAIRVFSPLAGLVAYKSIWQSISRAHGFVSKREKKYLTNNNLDVPAGCNFTQLIGEIQNHGGNLKQLIQQIRLLHGVSKLDITYGSMASKTAEAIFNTLWEALQYFQAYFQHIEEPQILDAIQAKFIASRMIETFFGHVTLGVQGNNLTNMQMNRAITNEAFTYILPYANSKDSGVSIATEKKKSHKYLYQDDVEVDDTQLIWQLQNVKQQILFTTEKKYQLILESKKEGMGKGRMRKSKFCFGKSDGCHDYMDLIDPEATRADFLNVLGALKSRPMKRLRDSYSYKRKFGTAPTILGCHYVRALIGCGDGTMSYIMNTLTEEHIEQSEPSDASDLCPGDFVVFQGTDGLPFNIICVTKPYTLQSLGPRSKISGNFLVPVELDDNMNGGTEDIVCFFEDPEWKGGSMPARDIIKDEDGAILMPVLQLIAIEGFKGTYFAMQKETFHSLQEISYALEEQLHDNKCVDTNETEEEAAGGSGISDDEEEPSLEQPPIMERSSRRNRGNRYATVLNGVLY